VPEEPSIAGVAPAAARKGKGAREGNFSCCLLPRVSSESARARRSTKTPAPDCAECSATVFVSSARNYAASARGGYSARGKKKAVILALRYFSVAARDALSKSTLQ
jgi:hypothetical protein